MIYQINIMPLHEFTANNAYVSAAHQPEWVKAVIAWQGAIEMLWRVCTRQPVACLGAGCNVLPRGHWACRKRAGRSAECN